MCAPSTDGPPVAAPDSEIFEAPKIDVYVSAYFRPPGSICS